MRPPFAPSKEAYIADVVFARVFPVTVEASEAKVVLDDARFVFEPIVSQFQPFVHVENIPNLSALLGGKLAKMAYQLGVFIGVSACENFLVLLISVRCVRVDPL